MRLTETEEQAELRAAVRRFLGARAALPDVRRVMVTDSGYDDAVWRQAATQLGLQGIAIPEEYGGAGFTFVEQAIVLEEMGRALFCGPYLAGAVLAANALLLCDDDAAKREYLPGIAGGDVIATLAFAEDGGVWQGDGTGLTAGRAGDGWRLTGHRAFVLDGHHADLVLTVARTPDDVSLFAVRGGVTATLLPTLDQTRRLARLEYDDTPATRIGPAADLLPAVLDVAAVALAAEQLGGAQAALDMAVGYLKVREQFGRPVGSFQALKHRAADLLLEIESTRSAVLYASWVVAEASDELPGVASLVKAYASDTYSHAAGENIQMHGGIGFTWEHDAHLYFKRASFSQLFLGDPAYHRERLITRIGV